MEIICGKYFRVMISFTKSAKFLDLEIIPIYGTLFDIPFKVLFTGWVGMYMYVVSGFISRGLISLLRN